MRFQCLRGGRGAEAALLASIKLMEIHARQLPKMGAEYLAKLIFEPHHRSIVCVSEGAVVGRLTYRPWGKARALALRDSPR